MKRPQGFDRQASPAPSRRREPAAAPTPATGQATPPSTPQSSERGTPQAATGRRMPRMPRIRKPAGSREPSAAAAERAARRQLRRAEAARKRYERDEVRRFTRRTRRRRAILATAGGAGAVLLIAVVIAVFSPALALRNIQIEGATRVSADEVRAAIDDQLGTPLALIDLGRVQDELGAFPVIRSFVTEAVPPDTLVVRITERDPIGTINSGAAFDLVDPAGVVIATSDTRVDGVPVIDVGGHAADSAAFESVVEVLLAVPTELRGRIDAVTARSKDDVTLVLDGVGQSVSWGSADGSAQKARVLAELIRQTDPALAGEFDVSAPTIAVFRPA
ncbi:FtsQ-type POTRA domain-containing protein [Salinibacterium sp. ZJ450]|uniref:FtsQ-type POTRA domain-containing protein n=1 Tax=Salinibacterium sp. ZJ450 TaxID=2708338 RepID=UPI001CD708FC|nr:FtsQ-type POTRA domain-containing protein [Salinibacterium sp. ZJ450]